MRARNRRQYLSQVYSVRARGRYIMFLDIQGTFSKGNPFFYVVNILSQIWANTEKSLACESWKTDGIVEDKPSLVKNDFFSAYRDYTRRVLDWLGESRRLTRHVSRNVDINSEIETDYLVCVREHKIQNSENSHMPHSCHAHTSYSGSPADLGVLVYMVFRGEFIY